MCRLSADKRAQTGGIWAFNGKRCCKSFVSDKTNRTKSDVSSLTARERAQKSADLLFSAVARRTTPQKHSRLASLGAVAILLVSSPLSCAFICHRQRYTHSAPNRRKQSTYVITIVARIQSFVQLNARLQFFYL